jgi:hypothetical protein
LGQKPSGQVAEDEQDHTDRKDEETESYGTKSHKRKTKYKQAGSIRH